MSSADCLGWEVNKTPRFQFSIDGLEVLHVTGVEEMSRPYQFELNLVAPKNMPVPLESVVGKNATLTICGLSRPRFVHGTIWHFELAGELERKLSYRLVLTSHLLKLTLRKNMRIFQSMKTQDIVAKVLKEGGITDPSWKLKDPDSYKPRDYCVQYRETDLEFISRLLEEEGIAYHFVHEETKATMVLTDANAALVPIDGVAAVYCDAAQGAVHDIESVDSFTFGQRMRPDRVVLRDYNFKETRPVVSEVGEESNHEIYDYPGEFTDTSLGDRLALVRLQELQAARQLGSGAGDCNRFFPGRRFTLGIPGGLHPVAQFNQEYLLTLVSHSGSQPRVLEEGASGPATYSNSFQVIPASVEYRPERRTPRPIATGTHTAVVVGPEEIYTDQYGRVRVQFHWDRGGGDNPEHSCWIRVSQGWAGAGYGSIYIPRVGQEVLVNFLEGDPDRPVITGRVYNGHQVPPYPLPRQKTKSTLKSASSPGGGGSNEIRFEDQKGAEEIYIHAQKDLNEVVEDSRTTKVGQSDTTAVGTTSTTTVGGAATLTVGGHSQQTAPTVHIMGGVVVVITVGASVITLTPGSITIASPKIDIRGQEIKINDQQERQQGNW
jgi:type VI secretion system secreted protein VgrG